MNAPQGKAADAAADLIALQPLKVKGLRYETGATIRTADPALTEQLVRDGLARWAHDVAGEGAGGAKGKRKAGDEG